MELYSAIILLCTFKDEKVGTCSTVTYPAPFTSRIECMKHMANHEIKKGPVWDQAGIYVVSSTCIDWKWYTNRRLLRAAVK